MTRNILDKPKLLYCSLAVLGIVSSIHSLTKPAKADEGTAADLIFTPRWYVGHRVSRMGFDGFTFFDGFVPLNQNPNYDLTFLSSRLSLDNSLNVGASFLLGHRTFIPSENRITGGYLAYDVRDTGQSTFHQLGVGLSNLGETWDFHLHGYIPLGNTRRLVSEHTMDAELKPAGNPRFQGNSLMLPAERSTIQTQNFETIVGGVDIEIGARLARFDNGGDLRAYAGWYFHNTSGTNDSWGGSLRLAARPTQNFYVGLGLQQDTLRGTNVLLDFAVSLSAERSRPESNAVSILPRLAEAVDSRTGIKVFSQTESEIVTEQVQLVATNPETGNPYQFQHVNLETSGGDGSFESPFGALETALAVTAKDNIVYVQSGINSSISGFTIPDDIWLLSTGPEQYIETVELSMIQLPLSGTNQFPTVTDTVLMGNSTIISGFSISNSNGSGIEASNISDVTILNNRIIGVEEYGILLRNVGGTVLLDNNIIADTQREPANLNLIDFENSTLPSGQGILFVNDESRVDLENIDLSIINNTLDGNANQGILLANIHGSISILGNEIHATNGFNLSISGNNPIFSLTPDFPTGQGILFINTSGDIDHLVIAENVIEQNTSQGILLVNLVGGQIDIIENTITNTRGLLFGLPNFLTGQGLVLANLIPGNVNLNISGGNRISENTDDGVLLVLGMPMTNSEPGSMTTANITISDNTVENNGSSEIFSGDGIGIALENNTQVNSLIISNNIIGNNGDNGIDIRSGFFSSLLSSILPDSVDSSAKLIDAKIISNTIRSLPASSRPSIRLDAYQSTTLQTSIEDNQISVGTTGLEATLFPNTANEESAEVCLRVQNNQGEGSSFNFANLGSGTFQILNLSSVRTDNTGEFRIGTDIIEGTLGIAPCP